MTTPRSFYLLSLLAFSLLSSPLLAQSPTPAAPIEAVLLHPLFNTFYTCTEHWAGQLSSPGDALGTDCHIQQLEDINGRLWLRSYLADGLSNADWYGWHADVLAPCSGSVEKININPTTNVPGIMGEGSASFIILKCDPNLLVMVAHAENFTVKEADTVRAGQIIARVGNNGYSRHPHIHIGAWRADNTPLQIRFDQTQMQKPAPTTP